MKPGSNIDVDKAGVYCGQAARSFVRGRDHGFMPIVVNALSKDDFATWLKAKQLEQHPPAAADASAPAAAAAASAPAAVAQ